MTNLLQGVDTLAIGTESVLIHWLARLFLVNSELIVGFVGGRKMFEHTIRCILKGKKSVNAKISSTEKCAQGSNTYLAVLSCGLAIRIAGVVVAGAGGIFF